MTSTMIAKRRRRIFQAAATPGGPVAADRNAATLTPLATFGLSLWAGLLVGIVELACELARFAIQGEHAWLGNNQLNPHYLWMIPVACFWIFGVTGGLLGLVAWLQPHKVRRIAIGVLVFLAAFLLFLTARSVHMGACAVFAAGVASLGASWLPAPGAAWQRMARRSSVGLVVLVAGLAAFSFARDVWREQRALNRLPAAAPGAPNVLLIVLDTVRADALTPYGSHRDTTPTLNRLSRQGVRFENARATAPWTLPSHASMFTGHWPHALGVSLTTPLDDTHLTLAKFLKRRGYATAGFAANHSLCTPSYGLDRGFIHYEGRPISLDDIFGCTALGQRFFPHLDVLRYAASWLWGGSDAANAFQPFVSTHRKNAEEINRDFLRWVSAGTGRPFFAFLNYFDVHSPYVPPRHHAQHFGLRPEGWADYSTLRDWEKIQDVNRWSKTEKIELSPRDITLARDGYDDGLAYLDGQLGRLFTALEQRGILRNTLVIVTSDHGEEFGEHGLFFHFASLHRPELDVPLLMTFPSRIPPGLSVTEPVSLRCLPATIVDLIGAQGASPFPGRSLARFWNGGGPADEIGEAVYSELAELGLEAVNDGPYVYIHHASGFEQLFHIKDDPGEDRNLAPLPEHRAALERLRAKLTRINAASPRKQLER
ncbi:MAG: sulfatase [Isosphaeraceae bacterium]|nr:sulfatase [Isosphaeraceae bacterium]